ncbi:hypothetical protein ACFL5N_00345 [bacterium]
MFQHALNTKETKEVKLGKLLEDGMVLTEIVGKEKLKTEKDVEKVNLKEVRVMSKARIELEGAKTSELFIMKILSAASSAARVANNTLKAEGLLKMLFGDKFKKRQDYAKYKAIAAAA